MPKFVFFLLSMIAGALVYCSSFNEQLSNSKVVAEEPIKLSDFSDRTASFSISEKFRHLMLKEDYKEALKYVNEYFDETKSSLYDNESRSIAKYLATAYIYIMLGDEQKLLENHDEIARKYLNDSWQESMMMQMHVKSSLFARLNQADKLIKVCDQYIIEHEVSPGNEYAYTYAGIGLAVKGEYEKARLYLLAAERSILLLKKYYATNKIEWDGGNKDTQFMRRVLSFFVTVHAY